VPPIDLELPVDPNEPTYCLCNQVSYGEMVACDNANVCKILLVYQFTYFILYLCCIVGIFVSAVPQISLLFPICGDLLLTYFLCSFFICQCKIEWFHFGCVGLKEQPKGKWYCNDCATLLKRKKGSSK
jgi:inhibitor of growth protein 4